MTPRRRLVLGALWLAVVALASCGEPHSHPVEPTGKVSGRVYRAGEPASAHISLHLFLAIDPDDPYEALRDFQRPLSQLRACGGMRPPLATLDTDADGRFTMSGLAPGLYEIHARAEDGAREVATFTQPTHGGYREVLIELPTAFRTVRGKATNADGTPFVGFVETPLRPWGSRFPLPSWGGLHAPVDADGRFEIEGVPEGALGLSLVVPGHLRVTQRHVIAARDGEVDLSVPQDRAGFVGRALEADTGRPLAGADVVAWCRSHTFDMTRRLETDGDGYFHAPSPEGKRGALVKAPGLRLGSDRLDTGERGPLEIALQPGATVRGRVVDRGTGKAVAGAVVWVGAPGYGFGNLPTWLWNVQSDADGAFLLEGLPPLELDVFVAGGGWWSPELALPGVGRGWGGYDPLVRKFASGETTEVRIEVEPTVRIEGCVHGPDGSPLAGALIRTTSSPLHARFVHYPEKWILKVGQCTSGADGRYVLTDVDPDRAPTVEVAYPGLPVVATRSGHPGAHRALRVDVDVPAGLWLRCTVLDEESGAPVPGARVSAEVPDLSQAHRSPTRVPRTNAKGRVRLGPLHAESAELRAYAETYDMDWQEIDDALTPEDGVERERTFHLRRQQRLEGVVLAPDGIPLGHVEVQVEGARLPGGPHVHLLGNGLFEVFCNPEQTPYVHARLLWEGQLYEGLACVTPDAERIEVTISSEPEVSSPDPVLRVHVLDPTGRPAYGLVTLEPCVPGDGNRRTHAWSGEGVAELTRGHAPGAFRLSVAHVEGAGHTLFGPFEPGRGTLTVRLEPERLVTGRVTWPDGRGARGVWIEAREAETDVGRLGEARTDGSGRFEVHGLGAEEVVLEFEGPPDHLEIEDQTVVPGGPPVEIRLRREAGPVDIDVVLIDDLGVEFVEGAVVQLVHTSVPEEDAQDAEAWPRLRRAGLAFSGTTDTRGRLVVSGLEATATYRLQVEPPWSWMGLHDPQRAALTVLKEAWTPVDDVIRMLRPALEPGRVLVEGGGRLPSAVRLRGRVVIEGGGELPDAVLVRHWSPDGELLHPPIDEDGTFTVGRAPGETIRLEASGWNRPPGRRFESGEVVSPADETDVVLVLRPVKELERTEPPPPTLVLRIAPWTPPSDEVVAEAWAAGAATGRVARGAVDANGHVRIEVLEDELEYEVWVHGGDAGWYAHAQAVRPSDEEQTLRPTQGEAISGRVKLPPAESHREVEVLATSNDGLTARTRTAADGTFRLVGLPSGTWRLRAEIEIGGRPHIAYRLAEAGTTEQIVIEPTR